MKRNTVSYREIIETINNASSHLESWMDLIEEVGMEDTEPENVQEMQFALNNALFECSRLQTFLEGRI